MNEPKRIEINQWLIKSKHDIGSAYVLINNEEPFFDTALYHCQQAVEKTLKAYLTYKDVEFEKTHNLVALTDMCLELEPIFTDWKEIAKLITPYATELRYPGDASMPEKEEAEKVYANTENFLDFILKLLPDEVKS
jgi:HEPN domain-containing protein